MQEKNTSAVERGLLLLLIVFKKRYDDENVYEQVHGDGDAWACAEWWKRGDRFGDTKEQRGWVVGKKE